MRQLSYTNLAPIAALATAPGPAALAILRTSGSGSIDLLARVFSRPNALREAPGNTIVYGWIVKDKGGKPPPSLQPVFRADACSASAPSARSYATPLSGGQTPATPPVPSGGTEYCAGVGIESGAATNTQSSVAAHSRIDEVLVNVYRAPRSYTGEDGADIICHGGSAAPKAVLDTLLRAGFREALRGEFTFRAFTNGKLGLSEAESVLEMVEARTDKARENAAARLSGVLETEIDAIKQNLVIALAALELALDYSELDGIEDAPEGLPERALITDALARLETLAAAYRSQRLYNEGALVVIAGKPNAGKSSIFNLLLKEERAIVTPIPGTTRDYIEAMLDIGGIPVRLIDTAGLREEANEIEAEGIRRSRALMDEADLVLFVKDGAEDIPDPGTGPSCWGHPPHRGTGSLLGDSPLRPGTAPSDRGQPPPAGDSLLRPGTAPSDRGQPPPTGDSLLPTGTAPSNRATPVIIVWNKIDLAGTRRFREYRTANGVQVLPLSAKSGEGLSQLLQAVSETMLGGQPPEHAGNGPALGTERQRVLVDRAMAALRETLALADSPPGTPPALDLAAPALKYAVDALGEITGEVTNDAILTTMFTRFCVGK
jgi:tRNA modification GTPase